MGKNSRKNKLVEKYSKVEYSGDRVVWSKRVTKHLDTLPLHILTQFNSWVESVRILGVATARKIPGLHDEPLKGFRQGQRSVRLNRSYRAIYIETADGELKVIQVIEVNKHEY